jgi:thiosulfate/3-mercaptopyruvate sulfurtransferase
MLVTIMLALALAAPRQYTLTLTLTDLTKYAKPELLAEPADVVKLLKEDKVVVLDARPRKDYLAGHAPGARWVDRDAWNKAIVTDTGPDKWIDLIGALGIDGSRPVVVYDDDRSREASRVWWMLRHWGLGDVRVLNGGWKGWRKVGDSVAAEPAFTAAEPKLKHTAERHASREQMLELLKGGKIHQIIDARSKEEHCGEKATAKRNGAVPGAKHLEWSDTIDAKTGRFKSAPELKKLMKDAGIDPDKPTTTYCQSGGRAAVMAFVFELMSGKPAANYYRSWAEWGNDPDTPVVTPKKK